MRPCVVSMRYLATYSPILSQIAWLVLGHTYTQLNTCRFKGGFGPDRISDMNIVGQDKVFSYTHQRFHSQDHRPCHYDISILLPENQFYVVKFAAFVCRTSALFSPYLTRVSILQLDFISHSTLIMHLALRSVGIG